MSAFIVSDETITAMLQAATARYQGDGASYYWKGNLYPFNGHAAEVGQKLIDENYRSINYRYTETYAPHQYIHRPLNKRYEPVEIIKLCNCYRYQCCETDDWEDSEAYAIMDALKERAIFSLPGYDDAKWGL